MQMVREHGRSLKRAAEVKALNAGPTLPFPFRTPATELRPKRVRKLLFRAIPVPVLKAGASRSLVRQYYHLTGHYLIKTIHYRHPVSSGQK